MTELEEEQNVEFFVGIQHDLNEGTYLDEYW